MIENGADNVLDVMAPVVGIGNGAETPDDSEGSDGTENESDDIPGREGCLAVLVDVHEIELLESCLMLM